MLSFHEDTKKNSFPIAHGYDNRECIGKPIFTIFYIPDFSSPPEITSNDPKSLLESDRYRLCKEYALSKQEYNQLVDRVANQQPVIETSSRTLKKAYLEIEKLMHEKLKKCLEFSPTDKIFLKPIYDTSANRKNQILTMFGSSGCGKSWKVNDCLVRNPAVLANLVPMIYIFSSVDNDPSYQGLRELYGEKFVHKYPRDLEPSDLNVKMYDKKSVLIFDDVNSIGDKRIRQSVINFRNNLLEIARHRSLVVISTEHLFHNRVHTQKLRNSSAYMCLYPRNSKKALDDILENNMNLNRHQRTNLLKQLIREGRAQFVHMDNPPYIINTKRCQLF